jgi:hypothetical protein
MLETYQTLVNNLFESESGREENASNNSFHVDHSLFYSLLKKKFISSS